MFLLIRVITICKHVRVFHGFSQVGDFYYKVIYLTIPSMGRISLSQSIEIQNLANHLFRMLTWCGRMGLNMKAITRWQFKPHTSPMLMFLRFWRMNEGMCKL
jgi:hypothetical protein